ncbi:MAG: transposase [Brachybacterium sp.]|uniref:transposase n=1 Tax=Brachybacterium sp. TaxID=1891286 RepID=UPI0026473CE5|nr:transposase [Brachybacterium sp.]MDN5685162.1 transposase [Brachybacterium sp.]
MDSAEVPAVSHADAVLLTDTIGATDLARSLREALVSWAKPLAEHDATKVLLDLAMTLAVGAEVASDTGLLCCEPGVFGDAASSPTISRMPCCGGCSRCGPRGAHQQDAGPVVLRVAEPGGMIRTCG